MIIKYYIYYDSYTYYSEPVTVAPWLSLDQAVMVLVSRVKHGGRAITYRSLLLLLLLILRLYQISKTGRITAAICEYHVLCMLT